MTIKCHKCNKKPVLLTPNKHGRTKYHLSCSGVHQMSGGRLGKEYHHGWLHVSGDSEEEVIEKWEKKYA